MCSGSSDFTAGADVLSYAQMCKNITILGNSELTVREIKELSTLTRSLSLHSGLECNILGFLFGSQTSKLCPQTELRADWKWPLPSFVAIRTKPLAAWWNTALVITFIVTESPQLGITFCLLPGNVKNIVLSTSGLFCGQLSFLTAWVLLTGEKTLK